MSDITPHVTDHLWSLITNCFIRSLECGLREMAIHFANSRGKILFCVNHCALIHQTCSSWRVKHEVAKIPPLAHFDHVHSENLCWAVICCIACRLMKYHFAWAKLCLDCIRAIDSANLNVRGFLWISKNIGECSRFSSGNLEYWYIEKQYSLTFSS